MKKIYFIFFYLICFCSYSQIEEVENIERWQILGSNTDGSILLKLEEKHFYNLSFRNYKFSDKRTIKSIYFKSSDLGISNLYSFLLRSFDLSVSEQSSFKIEKYKFQVSKNIDKISVDIVSQNSNEPIGRVLLTKKGLNNLFAKYKND